MIKLDISTFEPSMFCLLELYLFFHSLSYKAFWERSSLFKGCLPSKEVFHRWLSSFIKGFRPSNVVFHQRLSSIKLVFHQNLSSFKGHLPSKVALHQRSFFLLWIKLGQQKLRYIGGIRFFWVDGWSVGGGGCGVQTPFFV